MPIEELTTDVDPAFARIGTIYMGGKKEGNKPGKDLPYFRFESDREEVRKAFYDKYGAQPKEITIYLPAPNIDQCFPTWYELWGSGSIVWRCSGKTCVLHRDQKGAIISEECPCTHDHKKDGTRVGRLHVMIDGLIDAGYVGYVSIQTHSINSIVSIYAALAQTLRMRGDNPAGLTGIPFTIRKVPEMISTPTESGNRVRRQVFSLRIEPAASAVRAMLQASRSTTMLESPDAPALLMPPEDDPAEPQEIEEAIEGEFTEKEEPQPAPAQPTLTQSTPWWTITKEWDAVVNLRASCNKVFGVAPDLSDKALQEEHDRGRALKEVVNRHCILYALALVDSSGLTFVEKNLLDFVWAENPKQVSEFKRAVDTFVKDLREKYIPF